MINQENEDLVYKQFYEGDARGDQSKLNAYQ